MKNATHTVLYKWFNEVWNKNDVSAIEKLMTPDALAHGILDDSQPKGAEGFQLFFKSFTNEFADIKIELEEIIAQDDMECARTVVKGMHRITGKPIEFSGICMVRTKDGKIAEAWNNYDFLQMHQQLVKR